MKFPHPVASLSGVVVGTLLAVSSIGAIAQPASPASSPTTVGVTPQDAAEANRKAVPRADTGTVVRTGDSAADKARSATDAVPTTNTVPPAAPRNNNAPMATSGSGAANSTVGATSPAVRPARADRN